jgi:hypothetical protein
MRVLGVTIILVVLFISVMLNPQVLYANKKSFKQITVYYHQADPSSITPALEQAVGLVRQSELYDSSFRFHIFLNDGASVIPVLRKALGDAFAWGYYNNVVLNGAIDNSNQYLLLNNHQRHLARTLAHEMIHDLQAHRFGVFQSRPVKNVPVWKWEGYPEYIAYRSTIENEPCILLENIFILQTHANESSFPIEINIDEGRSFAGLDYFRWWLMVKYLVDIKQMNFAAILKDEVKYEIVYADMLHWYHQQINNQAFSPPAGP